jgi:uncharacterized protein
MITPCIKVCKIASDTLICIGCFRTLQEISDWSHLTDTQRQTIMNQIKKRNNEKEKNCIHSVCTEHTFQTQNREVP